MATTPEPTSATADREIVTSRVFAAPRELVYSAWTDPRHVGHWWGPNGFTLTTEVMDVRPGGEWRYVMHGPDGTDYVNVTRYLEVEAPARLVYEQGGGGATAHMHFQVTITFTETAGGTLVTMHHVFPTAAARDEAVQRYGAIEGGKQHLAKLGYFVAGLAGNATAHDIISRRIFAVAPATLFAAWLDPAVLARWWGPQGFTNIFHVCEPRAGGEWRFTMRGSDGTEYPNHCVFRSIEPHQRIVIDHLGSMHAFTIKATFTAAPGGTLLEFRMWFADAAESAKVRTFAAPCNEEMFDRLATVLPLMG